MSEIGNLADLEHGPGTEGLRRLGRRRQSSLSYSRNMPLSKTVGLPRFTWNEVAANLRLRVPRNQPGLLRLSALPIDGWAGRGPAPRHCTRYRAFSIVTRGVARRSAEECLEGAAGSSAGAWQIHTAGE